MGTTPTRVCDPLGRNPSRPNDFQNLVKLATFWQSSDSLALSDGTLVSSEPDLTGITGAFTQGVTLLQPTFKTNITNGLPIIRYANIPSRLVGSITVSAPFTMAQTIIVRGNSSGYNALLVDNSSVGFYTHNGFGSYYSGGAQDGTISLTNGVPVTLFWVATSNTTMDLYVNKVFDKTLTVAINSTTLLNIGSDTAGDNGDFDDCEKFYFPFVLSAAQRTTIYNRLKRWGTA